MFDRVVFGCFKQQKCQCLLLTHIPVFFPRKYFLYISFLLYILLLVFSSGNAYAGTTGDVIEGAGELSKFGIDVLEDFGLEGKSSEESGKARLEDFLKGKTKDYIKDKLTGGGDLSEGMGLILNKIFDGINSKKVGGPCNLAALNQAWGIAFDAKNTRLLRGAANIWFDVLTSIPGVPALAEKLVMETGTLAYKKLRSQIEDKIKEWWATQKDEAFETEKQSGPCSIKMKVLWNKKKNKYLFLITGKCDCKLVPIEPLGRGGTITLKSFQVIGGGSITPSIDVSNPNNPKVKLVAGFPSSIKVMADCNCATDTSLPPPEEDPIEEWVTAPRMSGSIKKAKCEACQPLLDTVNAYVADYNKLADRMDALGKEITGERYKTPERDANIKEWEKLSKQQEKIEEQHDKVFAKFAKCEEEECKLGTGPVALDQLSTLSEQWTDCDKCISIMEAVNAMIKDYNNKVKALNALASYASRAKLKLGTAEGNRVHREWHKSKPALDTLNASIQKKIGELSACKAKHCSGREWATWTKVHLISGTCTPCFSYQESYNAAVKEYNATIDKLNALEKKQKEYIEKYGDSGAGRAGYEDLLEKGDLHGLLKAEREGRAKLDSLKAALDGCIKEKCALVEVIDVINLIGNDPFDRQDPISEGESTNSTPTPSTPTPTPVATIQVLPGNIPVSRFASPSPPDACAEDHYHAVSVLDCDGNIVVDPAPAVCGFGTVSQITTIPLSSCANP